MLKIEDINIDGPQLEQDELDLVSGGEATHRTDRSFRDSVNKPQGKINEHAHGGFDADYSAAPILD